MIWPFVSRYWHELALAEARGSAVALKDLRALLSTLAAEPALTPEAMRDLKVWPTEPARAHDGTYLRDRQCASCRALGQDHEPACQWAQINAALDHGAEAVAKLAVLRNFLA